MTKEKIAVVLPNHLGDVAMATPALRSLRRGRPEAEIAVIEKVHPKAYIDAIRAAEPEEGYARIDADTVMSPEAGKPHSAPSGREFAPLTR